MASNRVHGGRRIKVIAGADHSAGDLVYEKGFYGIVQDDCDSGDLITLILDSVWRLPNVPSTLAMGVVVAAEATSQATTLQILALANHPSAFNSAATANWHEIGRTIETGTATTAKIQLNPYRSASF